MVSARYFPLAGGTETHVYEVSQRLVNMGYRITVCTTDPSSELAPYDRDGDVEIVRLRAYPKHSDLYFAPALGKFVRDGQWDLLHLQGYHTFVAPLALFAAKRRGIPYVVTFHSGGHSSRWRNSIRHLQIRLLRPLLTGAEQLIGVSEFEAEHFSRLLQLPREAFRVVPNGAKLPEVDPDTDLQRDPNRLLILSIGRLERYKRHQAVISALPKVLEQEPRVYLRIVGSGRYKNELHKLVKSLNLESRVEIAAVPSTDRQGMAKLLLSASLVSLLSEYEAHPIAVMEALAMGRPVLVADTSGLGELARRGFVRSIPLDAPDGVVAEAILAGLREPFVPDKVELPTWESCVGQLDQIYREILQRHSHSDR